MRKGTTQIAVIATYAGIIQFLELVFVQQSHGCAQFHGSGLAGLAEQAAESLYL